VLGVDSMLRRIFLADRPEGVEAHVELDRFDAHAFVDDPFEELGCEVEAGGWSGGRALVSGEHSLVLALVLERLCYVGRQWHSAEPVDGAQKARPVRGELHEPSTALVYLCDDQTGEQPVTEDDLRSGLESASGLDQALPRTGVALSKQQDLRLATGPLLRADKPAWQYARLVDHEQVALAHVVRKITEGAMLHSPTSSVEHEQPTGVPGLRGVLRDEPGR